MNSWSKKTNQVLSLQRLEKLENMFPKINHILKVGGKSIEKDILWLKRLDFLY